MASFDKKILFTIFSIAVISCSIFFFAQNSLNAMLATFRNEQVLYAEMPTDNDATSTAATAASSTPKIRVPILVYHIVRPSYPTDSRSVIALAHTPEVFDAEMRYLGDAGYHVIPFRALESNLLFNSPLPANPIVITFDDGWRDQFEYAFPILKKYGYTATFFVFTNPIGRRGFVTWDDLRQMRDADMTIGSHSLSHPFLTKIADPALLWKEIDGSKKVIEKNLHITVSEFAYPFGQYNASTTELVAKAGYVAARGDYLSRPETAGQIYTLSALNAPTTTELFARRFPAQNR